PSRLQRRFILVWDQAERVRDEDETERHRQQADGHLQRGREQASHDARPCGARARRALSKMRSAFDADLSSLRRLGRVTTSKRSIGTQKGFEQTGAPCSPPPLSSHPTMPAVTMTLVPAASVTSVAAFIVSGLRCEASSPSIAETAASTLSFGGVV